MQASSKPWAPGAAGAPPGPISTEDHHPLLAAAQAGAAGTVAVLLDQGTELDLANNNGWSALFFASASDSIGTAETVKLLLERGVNIHTMDRYGFTALQLAAFSSHAEVVAQLLDEGADVEASKPDGATPLVLAAANCQTEVMAMLLDRGANIEAADPGGSTPLIQAAFHGHTDVVQLLLARNANVNAATKAGLTALMVAACNGRADVVPLILDQGGDPAAKNESGQTAYELASADKLGKDLKARLKPELGRKRKAGPPLDDGGNGMLKAAKLKVDPSAANPEDIAEQPLSGGTQAAAVREPAAAVAEPSATHTPSTPVSGMAIEPGQPGVPDAEVGKPLMPPAIGDAPIQADA